MLLPSLPLEAGLDALRFAGLAASSESLCCCCCSEAPESLKSSDAELPLSAGWLPDSCRRGVQCCSPKISPHVRIPEYA